MEKAELGFESFISDISPEYELLVKKIYDKLVEEGCGVKLQEAKSGHVVSFTVSGKTLANFVSRKKGPVVRIYGDNCGEYVQILASLPEAMQKTIDKAPVCRRLLDPEKCNARCPMGYCFVLNGQDYKKCRYNCFMFPITEENVSGILDLLDHEVELRKA